MKELFCCFFKNKMKEEERITFSKVEVTNEIKKAEEDRINDLSKQVNEALEKTKSYHEKLAKT